MKEDDIVSTEELIRVAGNANFGSASLRDVIAYAVLQTACGYSTGHTVRCMMEDLGFVSAPTKTRGRKAVPALRKKGREYLWAAFGKQSF